MLNPLYENKTLTGQLAGMLNPLYENKTLTGQLALLFLSTQNKATFSSLKTMPERN